MPEISEVVLINSTDKIDNRQTKHCVCISVSPDKYLLINSNNYFGGFEIKSDDYEFLSGKDRFIGCNHMMAFYPNFASGLRIMPIL
jgi:hypothetical protein